MEYLLLGIGIIAGVIAFVLLIYLIRILWKFGKYLKSRAPALWYIYSGFWFILLFIVLIGVFGGAISFYTQTKENKAKEAFLDSNAQLIDMAANDLRELKYLEDRTFYIDSDIDELAQCIPSLVELKKNYDYDSRSFNLSYAIAERAEDLAEKSIPWNNLTQNERDRISLKIIDCDKTLGLMTDDEYEREKRLISVKIPPISQNEIKAEIENLRAIGMSDAEIMDKLLMHEHFGTSLQLLVERFKDTGSIDPLYGVGNQIGLNTHDSGLSSSIEKSRLRLDKQNSSAEITRAKIDSIVINPKIDYTPHKATEAPKVSVEENTLSDKWQKKDNSVTIVDERDRIEDRTVDVESLSQPSSEY